MDPAQISDTYSKNVAAAIFDAPLRFEYHTQPAQARPNVLVAMPEVSSDFKTLTFELKPGIFFNDDPAFKGKKRELTAADYIYSIKRHYDPLWKRPQPLSAGERRNPGPLRTSPGADEGQEAL